MAYVYVVGINHEGTLWELVGVFSCEEQAVAACTTPDHFVGPVPMDEVLPDQTTPWPGAYYP